MNDRLFFTYERLEPKLYPEPRDIKSQLQRKFCNIYKDKLLSDILLSTEFTIKSIKSNDLSKSDKILLKYKIVSIDWDEIKHNKKVTFKQEMFRFLNTIEQNYE